MGILTDFVVAPDIDATAIGQSNRPADNWATLESKGVETIKLSTLYCSVTDTPYSNNIQASIKLVAGNEEEGPWVFKIPQTIISALADIEESSIPSLAARWVTTEELKMDGWSEADAAQFISELRTQALRASSTCNSLFLWVSL